MEPIQRSSELGASVRDLDVDDAALSLQEFTMDIDKNHVSSDVRSKDTQVDYLKKTTDAAEIAKKDFHLNCPVNLESIESPHGNMKLHDLERKLKLSKGNQEHNMNIQKAVEQLMRNIETAIKHEENKELLGAFRRVGSSRDGTRPGKMDEFDYMYQLNNDGIEVFEGKSSYALFNNDGIEVTANATQMMFRDTIDRLFEEELVLLPEPMKHSGFAAPRFSGVRRNGPATTLLFTWNMTKALSIDMIISYAFPECQRTSIRDIIGSKLQPVFQDNEETHTFKFGVEMVCLVPQAPDEPRWEKSSSELEAALVESIYDKAPAKRVIKLQKLISEELITGLPGSHSGYASNNDVGDVLWEVLNCYMHLTDDTTEQDHLRKDIKKLMLYAHVFLSEKAANNCHELSKPSVCLKSYAVKHVTLKESADTPGSFGPSSDTKACRKLLTNVVESIFAISQSKDSTVQHYFFPDKRINIYSRAAHADETVADKQAGDIVKKCRDVLCSLRGKTSRPGTFAADHGLNRDSTAQQQVIFKCKTCRSDIFKLGDLRAIQDVHSNRHYIVIDSTILQRSRKDVNIKNKQKTFGAFTKTADLLCLCDEDVGITAEYDAYGEVFVVKIRSFLVIDADGLPHTFNKWNKFPFHIQDLSPQGDIY